MKKLNYIFIVLSLGLVSLSSCKDDDGYDWGNYKPSLYGVSATTEVIANTNLTYEYSIVGIRGGSTYTWTVIEGSDMVAITAQTGMNYYKATLSILQESSVQKTAKITVYETTGAGVKCDPDTIDVTIQPYVAVALNNFCGAYTETNDEGSDGIYTAPVTIARDEDDEYFGLVITGVLGTDWWFGVHYGVLKVKFYGVDNSVTFDKQDTGIDYSSYGSVYIELTSSKGSFSLSDYSFSYTAKVTVSAGSFGSDIFAYTKDTK
jgi:hypothetical protein